MALGDYTRTTYVNGTTPAINATNLNNIEAKVDELDATSGCESGSNANGYYRKWSDGTLECYWTDTATLTTNNYGLAEGYYNVKNITFPAQFLSGTTPIVTDGCRIYLGAHCSCHGGGITNAGCALIVTGIADTNAAYPGYHAIGRWRA